MNDSTPDLKTTHNLPFESAETPLGLVYRVGTCTGQWGVISDCYYILSVINHEKGNGHLNDVFEWFEYSCKRDSRNLLVLECFLNQSFYWHLIVKRGFMAMDKDKDNVIKIFNRKAYKRMLKEGNEMIKAKTLKCK